jgi:hypothetical protein
VADTACRGDFGTARQRRFVRSVEVSAENQGLEIGGVGQVLSKSAPTRWKRRKKNKKTFGTYIYMYVYLHIPKREKTHTMETTQIIEIKRLFNLAEDALAKVEFNHNGTKVLNPAQQGVYTRYCGRAFKLKGDLTYREMAAIHREVIDERR